MRTVPVLAELKITIPTLLCRYHLLNLRHYEAEAFLPPMHCNMEVSADYHAYEQQQRLFLAKPIYMHLIIYNWVHCGVEKWNSRKDFASKHE